jgi:hypothetical protein
MTHDVHKVLGSLTQMSAAMALKTAGEARSYRAQVVATAAAAFSDNLLPSDPDLFVNLWRHERTGRISAEAWTKLDDAAEDAADQSGGLVYCGTIHADDENHLAFLDLRMHGECLAAEAELETIAERGHVNGLTIGAGRTVL